MKKGAWTHHSQLETGRKKGILSAAIKMVLGVTILGYLVVIGKFTHGREGGGGLGQAFSAVSLSSKQGGAGTSSARKTIAYAISVTADGPYMDGAAVLAHAIRKASADSKYGMELVAFVFPEVQASRVPLERAGWKLVERGLPLKIEDIEGDYLREHIVKNGCCGATELLKLYAWALLEYHRVVHLDMDSLVLQNMDELYEEDKDLIYTCDYGMMTKNSAVCPVQGGFFVLRPSQELFDGLVATVKKGDYRGDGTAWGGEKVGWFWGGMTIQGLLPYYFLKINDPSKAFEANRCVYNNMFDNPECKNATVAMVKNVHFTVCQKPWSCYKHDRNVACNAFLDKWHQLREELETKETGTSSESCDQHGKYHPMAWLAGPAEIAQVK